MNAEQKQRAVELLAAWRATAYALHADRMADLLQEMVDAPEAEPFAVIHLDGSFVHVEFKQTIAGTGKFEVYAAPPVPSVQEADPVLVVETEPGYWNRGHYCEGTKSYIDPTKVWGLPAGTKLYTTPPGVTYMDEPVGYLYTNVQSGEYHVSDYDDDYRGPERALWYIEPVYRRTKGQS